MTTQTDWAPLHKALQAIAARCDGARANDGVGFRGQDVLFGHRIATYVTSDEYTEDLAREVYRVCRIYKGQLATVGIDFDTLPKPEVEATETVHAARDLARTAERKSGKAVTVDVAGADFVVKGKTYDHRDVIKQAGARWDGADKVWRIPSTSVNDVSWLVTTLKAEVTRAAETLLEGADADAAAPEAPEAIKAIALLNGLQAILVWKNVSNDDFSKYLDDSRRLPGRKYLPKQQANMVDISEELLAFGRKHDFTGTDEVEAALIDIAEAKAMEAERATAAEAASKAHDTDRVVAISEHLYPFQRAGVAYVVDHAGGRAIIGDEMGLGKTRQGLSVLETVEAYPAWVICPAHLKGNWLKEIKALLPNRTVEVVSGLAPYPVASDIMIINYDILDEWVEAQDDDGEEYLFNPQGLLLDESHYVKNDKAQRTHAAKRIAARVPEAGVVVCLTGTPVLNRPSEIISQLEIINGLHHFGRKVDFLREYCLTQDDSGRSTYGGARNLVDLNRVLRQNVYVRREKMDVLTELPPKQRVSEFTTLSDSDLREYRKAKANIVAYLRDLKGNEAAYRAGRAEVLVRLNTLRQLVGRAKIGNTVEWVDNFVESTGRKLVVFAIHQDVQEGLAKGIAEKGYVVDRIKGGMSQAQVESVVRNFQEGATQVLVCSLKAGGTGHTLTAAQDVLLIEQGWTPGEHDQAEDRIHRIGAEGAEHITAHYLLAPDTVDDTMYNIISSKRAVVSAVTSGIEVEDTESIVDQVVDALLSGAATVQ